MPIDPKLIAFTERPSATVPDSITVKADLHHHAALEVRPIELEAEGWRELLKQRLADALADHLYGEARKAARDLYFHSRSFSFTMRQDQAVAELYEKLKATLRFAEPDPSKHAYLLEIGWTVDQFLSYMESQCRTPRALFSRQQISCLSDLAGVGSRLMWENGVEWASCREDYIDPLVQDARKKLSER